MKTICCRFVSCEGSILLQLANKGARCDYGLYVGAAVDNAEKLSTIGSAAAGLKMYLNDTFTTLKLDDITTWMKVREIISADL